MGERLLIYNYYTIYYNAVQHPYNKIKRKFDIKKALHKRHLEYLRIYNCRTTVCFVSYSLFSTILAHTMPKDMFLTWILFTLIWTIFSYLVWSANRQDTKGWILSTILLAILFSTCFTYTDNTISSTTILNFLLYVFLVVVLYKGTKETLIIVILSIILALILSKIKIQIIFTKSACIYFNSVLL